MKIGIIGSGAVGKVLANGFRKHGHDVMMGSRDLSKLSEWTESGGKAGGFADVAKFGDILVLAVKGLVAADALALAGVTNLAGKTVIDATNPIAAEPPVNGVLRFFTGPNESLMEQLQAEFPKARFVKAFSCVGNAYMVDPDFGGDHGTMFICGNDDDAKTQVKEILTQFGWEYEDLGKVEAARAIEPLCTLWCIPGMIGNGWDHTIKLVRKK